MGPGEGCLTHVCSARYILVFSFLSLCCFIPELSLESKMREIHQTSWTPGICEAGLGTLLLLLAKGLSFQAQRSEASLFGPQCSGSCREVHRTQANEVSALFLVALSSEHPAGSEVVKATCWSGSRLCLRVWSQRHGIISQRHRIRSCNCQQGMAK